MWLLNRDKYTLAEARAELINEFTAAELVSAAVNVDMLLEHVIEQSSPERKVARTQQLTSDQLATLRTLAARRIAGEPLQHVLEIAYFYDRPFRSTPAALIPRPETEVLVYLALGAGGSVEHVVDVGTGSGVIAVTLKLERPQWTVRASDISRDALALASENAVTLRADVEFYESNLLANVPNLEQATMVVANLPYLPETDQEMVSAEVRHDPASALYSGADGTDIARAFLTQLAEVRGSRRVLLELDPRNVHALAQTATEHGFVDVRVEHDLVGRERFLIFSQE